MSIPRCAKQVRMRLVDGTIVKKPGKTGSQWRFHYSVQTPKLICHRVELLAVNGAGVGESCEHFPVKLRGRSVRSERASMRSNSLSKNYAEKRPKSKRYSSLRRWSMRSM